MPTFLRCLLVILLLAAPARAVDVIITAPGGSVGGPGCTDGDKGDITSSAGCTVWTIDTGVVTYAKIQNVTPTRFLGRISLVTGPIEELTVAQVKTMLGYAFGDLLGTPTDAQIPDLNTLSTGLTPGRCVETDVSGKLGVAANACGVGTGGGSGISGATNHGLMIATGGATGTSLGVATNGQLPIGSTGADPVLASLSGTPNQIQVTPGAGSITLSIPTNPTLPGITAGSFVGPLTGSVIPRTATAGPGSPINANSNTTDQVVINELTANPVTFAVPTGAPQEGQRLFYVIYSTVARDLVWTTTTNGFAAEAGQQLPASSLAGSYLILGFRWGNNSARWALVSVSNRKPQVQGFADVASIAINSNTTELVSVPVASAQAGYTFQNPTGTAGDGQMLRVRIISPASAKPIIWGSEFTGNSGMPLAATTTGSGVEDVFGFQRNKAAGTWVMVATTQFSRTALLKACMIPIGDQVEAIALTNAKMGPRLRQCPALGPSGVVREIGIMANAGTPSIIANRKTGPNAALDLVSGALSTDTAGAYACARASGDTLSQNGTTTCSATLQNATYSGEVSFGTTSGTASTATEVTVIVFYTPSS